jgi:hypothetical protein
MINAFERQPSFSTKAFVVIRFIFGVTSSYLVERFSLESLEGHLESTFESKVAKEAVSAATSIAIMSAVFLLTTYAINKFHNRVSLFFEDRSIDLAEDDDCVYIQDGYAPDSWRNGGMMLEISDSYDLLSIGQLSFHKSASIGTNVKLENEMLEIERDTSDFKDINRPV